MVVLSHDSNWHGCLELVYEKQEDSTRILRAFNQAPLKVQRSFYPESKAVCHTISLHTAGGIVGGDRLNQSLQLNPQSRVLMTTAAASKIYGSNTRKAIQTIEVKVKEKAILEWLPQSAIIFNGAIYQQKMRVDLARDAGFFGWEILRFGRSARGEKFLRGEWRSQLEIWREGKLLWGDRQWFPGGEETYNHPHNLGGSPVIGQLIWFSHLDREKNAIFLDRFQTNNRGKGEFGTTQMQGNSLLCRYRGASVAEVKNWFIQIWKLYRQSDFGETAVEPRVWL
ncbi:MAG: urease accessory protein UreD [Cyanobacteria bacterium SBLK]|nr:urease accessory protein UreD [Cyanobacteria bacterium SBLK]